MRVTPRTWLLLSWIGVGALALLMHAVLLSAIMRSRKLPRRWRLLAWIPPVAPVVAWALGRRVSVILWALVMLTYLGLRLLEGRV